MEKNANQLVWIGAGSAEHPKLDFNDYSHVNLIDAREVACEKLKAAYGNENVSVIHALITKSEGTSVFITYNIELISSVQPVSGMKKLFPGLVETRREHKGNLPVATLLNSVQLNGEENTLVIDVMDLASELIEELISSKLLSRFSTLYITCGEFELYQGMMSLNDLKERLSKYFYKNKLIDTFDPDISAVEFKFDKETHQATKLKSYASEIESLKKLVSEKEKLVSEKEGEIGELSSNLKREKNKQIRHGDSLASFIHQCVMFFYGKAINYVDIGAFDGQVAQAFFKSKMRINEAMLLEPNPQSFSVLKEDLEDCPRLPKKLNVNNMAVSTSQGPLKLYKGESMSRVLDGSEYDAFDSVVEVPTISLQNIGELCSENRISILKIDVEGHEMEVLKSGELLFQNQQVDVIYIEAGLSPEGQQQVYYRLIDDYLTQFGYRLFRVFEQQYEWIEDSPFLRRWNMAYMSPEFAEKHPYRIVKELFELKEKRL